MNRRRFLKWSLRAAVTAPTIGVGYGIFEAAWFRVARLAVQIPNLPPSFDGKTIALLTDLHHGRYTSLHYIRTVVEVTNSLAPDLIALGGDYAHAYKKYLPPCFEALAGLKAPMGVFGVLGNHDHWYDTYMTKKCMRKAGILEVTNGGCWLLQRGDRLRIAGVDDYWEGVQNLDAALGDAKPTDAAVLLCHNPDFVETIDDRRVGLVLSGHTHGGQIVLPGPYAPFVPSQYGGKYLHGLVRTPYTQVYVSRGLATVGVHLRVGARPEITLLKLTPTQIESV
ncbi:MAG: metallophosphoesterase [Gemmataceae bacterium]